MFDLHGASSRKRLFIVVAVMFVLAVSWSGLIDRLSKEYVDASTVQALAAYAFARIINAAVTLASSISISASFGIGFDIQPFQVLDPVNDLVEQYSSAMKYAISSLVVQKILVEAVSTTLFKVSLTVLGGIFLVSVYFREGAYSFFMFRLFCLFSMVRFLIVLVILMNGIVDQAFVDKTITPRMQEVAEVASQLEDHEVATESGLSDDEIDGLHSMISQLKSEMESVNLSIESVDKEIKEKEKVFGEKKAEVESIEGSMGAVERFNVFSREESYRQARQEMDEAGERLNEKLDEKSDLKESLIELDREIQNSVALLEGGGVEESWLSSARERISKFRDMAKWERIKESVESIIPSMLNLMAAFVFKTMIMPIVFLLLFLKGFKFIWGVDPRKWVKDEYKSMKKVER